MLNLLHDPEVYTSIRKRMQSLRVDTRRHWGKMNIDQMLWHVNVSMREAVGDYMPQLEPLPIPKAVFRWAVIHIPWGRGARTRPDMYPAPSYDFDTEKTQCLSLLDRIVARPLSGEWPESASM